jgi:hypothetical protein
LIREGNNSYSNVLRRFECGDALLFFYAVAFCRQYLWLIPNNRIAWLLSVVLAAAFSYFYISTRQIVSTRPGFTFWLLVIPTFLLFYSLRVAFPDRSDDVWAYHILNSERSLRGPLYAAGDYFPTALPFNPIPDTLTGITKLLLGYRLGTVLNVLALLWAATVVEKILAMFIGKSWLRYLAVLLVLLAENFLFEISTYMVDLLTLPLLLEATYLTLNFQKAKNRQLNFLHIALLLGASVAFKLTNLAVVIPLALICAYQIFLDSRPLITKAKLATVVLMTVAFVAPLLPFTIYIYRLTGNPVFPVANTIFQSPFWPTHGGWDDRWGPVGFWQTIAWPILVWFNPTRHSEIGVYSGRLSFAFIVGLVALPFVWRKLPVRLMIFLLVLSSWLWSVAAMGYARYGLFEDALGGIVLTAIAATLIGQISLAKVSWRTAGAFALLSVMVVQSYFAIQYVLTKEWGMRPTIFASRRVYTDEARFILHDYSLPTFLPAEMRARIDQVDVWFETGPKSTGFEVMLNPRAPIIALRQAEYFFTRDAWRTFISKVKDTGEQHMYSLCLNNDLDTARQAITSRGLEVGEVLPLDLQFFSPRDIIGMKLIEVRMPQSAQARTQFEQAWMRAAFRATDYREEISALNAPSQLHTGEKFNIQFKVRNLGSAVWPAVGTEDYKYQMNLGNRWILNGKSSEDNRAVMKADLPPGGETDIKLTVNAPTTPGEYTLEIDMVHEGVTWFKERGATPLLLKVSVVQ